MNFIKKKINENKIKKFWVNLMNHFKIQTMMNV